MNNRNKYGGRVLRSGLIASLLLGIASSASAGLYTVDTYLGKALLDNSGAASELAAMQQAAGQSNLALDFKVDVISATLNPGTTDEWYFNVEPATPGYFLLKFGIGGTSADADTFFFQNVADLTKLVWSNSQVEYLSGGNCSTGNDSLCNIGKLSHYTAYDPTTRTVPEPGSLWTLGLGLLGITIAGRYMPRKKSGPGAAGR